MFDTLTKEQFAELATEHDKIVVHEEISGDMITPVSAYLALGDQSKGATLLESSPKEKDVGRFSFLSFTPLITIASINRKTIITEQGNTTQLSGDPIKHLRDYRKQYYAKTAHPLAGYLGGVVGFIAYDAVRLFEKIPDRHSNEQQIPELLFKIYQDSIAFDLQTGKVVIATLCTDVSNPDRAFDQARDRIKHIKRSILSTSYHAHSDNDESGRTLQSDDIKVDIDDQSFADIVIKAKEYIRQGDVFQVVPSRRFQVDYTADPFTIYRALRLSSPAPYMFYLDNEDYIITGASPEKLISIKNNIVESCPLAGTRLRGDAEQESAIEIELLADKKEEAEHMMLVDLARNDIGAIAKPGTVHVKSLKQIQKFSHVMHLSSAVQGQLNKGMDALDALIASFPAGTLSGAPKIRAMQLIDELENSRRGIYGGAICAIDSEGDLNSCIAIRMAVLKDGVATIRTGAGIVHDSDPKSEAEETRHKAKSVLSAIALAEGGLA